MRTNETSTSANILQNEQPARPRSAPEDRRPTILTQNATAARSLFAGWGPRLGM